MGSSTIFPGNTAYLRTSAIMISEILTPAVFFGGRLGEYKYYDMDEVIAQTLKICRKEWDSQD